MEGETRYRTTPSGEIKARSYQLTGRAVVAERVMEQSFEQILVFFSGEEGWTTDEAIKSFKLPIPPPETPEKLETRKLFDCIVRNFETLFRQIIGHGWIKSIG